jgi:hypothetical protein
MGSPLVLDVRVLPGPYHFDKYMFSTGEVRFEGTLRNRSRRSFVINAQAPLCPSGVRWNGQPLQLREGCVFDESRPDRTPRKVTLAAGSSYAFVIDSVNCEDIYAPRGPGGCSIEHAYDPPGPGRYSVRFKYDYGDKERGIPTLRAESNEVTFDVLP